MLPFIYQLFGGQAKSEEKVRENEGGTVDFPCVVTGHLGKHQFCVRCDEGRYYTVETAPSLAHLMEHRARIRIKGPMREGIVYAKSIVPLEHGLRSRRPVAH